MMYKCLFLQLLSFLIICFCCFMIFFANNFLSYQEKQQSLQSWRCQDQVTLILRCMYLYQTFTLLLLATPLGILIGRGVVPFSNAYMYQMLGVHKDPSIIPSEAYIYSFVLVAIVLSMICVLTAGFLHKNDIQTLTKSRKRNESEEKYKEKCFYYFYCYLYIRNCNDIYESS